MEKEEALHFYQRLSKIDRDLNRILLILESDSRTHEKGLVEIVKDTRKDVDAILVREKVIMGKVAVYVFVGGLVITFLGWLLPSFINK